MHYRPSSRAIYIILLLALVPWLYISYPFWKDAFISLKTKGLSSIASASFFYRAAFCGLTLFFILAAVLIVYFLIVFCINKFHKARISKSLPSIPLSPEEHELYSAGAKAQIAGIQTPPILLSPWSPVFVRSNRGRRIEFILLKVETSPAPKRSRGDNSTIRRADRLRRPWRGAA